MDLYKIENKKAKFLKPRELSGPKGEEELQKLIEENLEEIFDLTFIESELTLQRKELDTLAFDKENNRIVVIEYKREHDAGVFDQGMTYLILVHENKDYIRSKIEKKIGKPGLDIEWDSTRVMFIAKKFDDFQITASSSKGSPFELWIYDLYDTCIVFDKIEEKKSRVAFNTLIKGQTPEFDKLSKEIKTYDLDYHLNKSNAELREVFRQYSIQIKSFGTEVIEVVDQKTGITYKNNKISFVRFEFGLGYINVIFKEKQGFVDPKNLSKDIKSNKWGFERLVKIESPSNLDYIIYLIKQAYETTL